MKLFKKLNEQIETEKLLKEEISKDEIKEIEEKIIFENFVEKLPEKDKENFEVI